MGNKSVRDPHLVPAAQKASARKGEEGELRKGETEGLKKTPGEASAGT